MSMQDIEELYANGFDREMLRDVRDPKRPAQQFQFVVDKNLIRWWNVHLLDYYEAALDLRRRR